MTQHIKQRHNPDVDGFLARASQWQEAFAALRQIVQACDLEEEFKWGKPCYALQGKNVVLMHGFRDYCALLFMKGALMRDPDGILVAQTENTQAARQIRFTSVDQVEAMAATLQAYVREAVEVEKAGLSVSFRKTEEFPVADELQTRLDGDPALKSAFESLTPGRQRGYLLHFSSAKQSGTRAARVEKCVPMILAGKGLNDR